MPNLLEQMAGMSPGRCLVVAGLGLEPGGEPVGSRMLAAMRALVEGGLLYREPQRDGLDDYRLTAEGERLAPEGSVLRLIECLDQDSDFTDRINPSERP